MTRKRIRKAGLRVTKGTRTALIVGAGIVSSVLIATGIVRLVGDDSDPMILIILGLAIIVAGVVFNISVGDKK